jgi:hypothetical protein
MPGTMRAAPRALATVLAVVYLACLVWQAPHTVHHFFEHQTEKSNECALNAAAERSTAMTVDAISLPAVASRGSAIAPIVPAVPARTPLVVLGPRAPPRPSV